MIRATDIAQLLELAARTARGAGYWLFPDAAASSAATPVFLPYEELAQRAAELSASLAAQGLRRGDRLAFIIPQQDLALGLWFACLRSGICPIAIREPFTASELAAHPQRVAQLVAANDARALVLTSRSEAMLSSDPPDVPMFLLDPHVEAGAVGPRADVRPHEIAVLPVDLSANTQQPLEPLTHAQVFEVLAGLSSALRLRAQDVFVSWLPPFEAAGLFALLLPLHCQRSGALLATRRFLSRPVSWLEAIDHVRGTISFAPAHGYAFCAKRVTSAQLSQLDLSCWRVAGCVDAALPKRTQQEFTSALSTARIRPDVFDEPVVLRSRGNPRASMPGALSHGQRGMWFLAQLEPHNTAYNVPIGLRISSRLDIDRLKRTLTTLLTRHDMLRSVYPVGDSEPHGEPRRKLLPVEQALDFARIDASALDEAALLRRAQCELETSFDLATGPLLRARLLVRSDTDALLLLVVHHINVDGSSIMQLGLELAVAYEAYARGSEPLLPPLEHTYEDFVRWQSELLASPEGARLRSYWRQQLAGAPKAISWRPDRARPAQRTERGGSIPIRIAPGTSTALRQLAQAQNTTLYTVLLGAYCALLHAESGDEDVVIATPTLGRSAAAFRGLVGYFVNTVPVRVRLTPQLTFAELIGQLRSTVLAALDHQDFPYALIVEDIQPERQSAHFPLCQVLFQLHGFRPDARVSEVAQTHGRGSQARLGELTGASIALPRTVSQFELAVELHEFTTHISGTLSYSADLWTAVNAQQLADELLRLVELIAHDPSARVCSAATRDRAPQRTPFESQTSPRPLVLGADIQATRNSP